MVDLLITQIFLTTPFTNTGNIMSNNQANEKIDSTEEAWETGLLGQSEEHVRVADPIDHEMILSSLRETKRM